MVRSKTSLKIISEGDQPKLPQPTPLAERMKKMKRWLRITAIAAVIGSVGFLTVPAAFWLLYWETAARCIAHTTNVEGNVLDEKGEQMIAKVIINRAKQVAGSLNFLQKICLVSRAEHWNRSIQKGMPDFSAMLEWWAQVPDQRSGWKRSEKVASDTLKDWLWEIWWPWHTPLVPELPPEYMYYHNSPAPQWFKESNGGLVCNIRHKGLDFCRPPLPPLVTV